ncbi:glycerate kinase family protein [Butyrivibrio sp. MC2013]|uniref:glycerate kinase family protein n=1 Tax=Butyrivibrio sp. MC2013 TaxID=1280686 RepID=UPI000401E1D1|nr:glycerate kinase [Butyrivibrio sp. MC2013]
MKILAAFDSFKGSMTSLEAGNAFAKGALIADPDIEVVVRPMADGGEGTVDALIDSMSGVRESALVTGPLGRPVRSEYGIIRDSNTAVMEMSAASGITLVPADELDPLHASSFGVGELIRDAIGKGCRRFIIGIGGSATNDGGAGMLMALGYDLMDASGESICLGAVGLRNLANISTEHLMPELAECEFIIACDVDNPLCGPMGCSAVYGPQKGASPSMVAAMDEYLEHFADVTESYMPAADKEYPGAGAAGGMGYAFMAYLKGRLMRGIDIVIEETGLEDYIRDADIVVTGEGLIDSQTAMGKAPVGVAALAQRFQRPVIALAGAIGPGAAAVHDQGISAVFPIVRGVCDLWSAMDHDNACRNMTETAEEVVRLIKTLHF